MTDESSKPTTDPNFKGGVMSPNSKQTFAELRSNPPVASKQKIIFDEDKFEHTFLRCQVCHDKFDMSEKAPRMLPCHHSFCIECILQLFEKEADYRRSLTALPSSSGSFAVSIACPTCTATFITTMEGIKQLTIDHRVVQLMDFVGNTDRQTIAFCANHTSQPLNFFCEQCIKPVCRDCTVLDHKECSSNQLVLDLDGAIKKYTPVLEKGVKEMGDEAVSLKEKKEECEKVISSCKSGDEGVIKEIKVSFEKIRKALDDREQELIDMAQANLGKGQDDVEAMVKTFEEKEKEVAEITKDIKHAQAEGKIQEMFKIYERIRNYKTEPALNKDDLNSNKKDTTKFNGDDDRLLISKISNFGDISTSAKHENGYSSGSSTGSGYSNYSSSYRSSPRYTGSSYTSSYTPRSYRY